MKEVDTLRLSPSAPPPPSPFHTWRSATYVRRFWVRMARGGKSHRGDPADGRRVGRASSVTVGPRASPDCAHIPLVESGRTLSDFRGGPKQHRRSTFLDRGIAKSLRRSKAEMVPDTEAVCQASETAVDTSGDTYEKIKDRSEKEVASVTAWKRYQRLVATMESQGGEFNRKSLIEAIFRGSDLVYASH